MKKNNMENLVCPIAIADYPTVTMAHGGGGRLMQRLIDDMFCLAFSDVQQNDSAVLDIPQDRIAMTTDSYVVSPLFFPGGNIATLAVNGTVNDLAMVGARPKYLSVSFILEEGFSMETLWRIVREMRTAANVADIKIVTGDTKVVERGNNTGIHINTTGIGVFEHNHSIKPQQVRAGDAVILSGDIGRHGMAVMATREGLSFESDIKSDCEPLAACVSDILEAGLVPHCLRDATRGGVAAVLNEVAAASNLQIDIREAAIHVDEAVRGACEILGFDPLHIANEGCFVAFAAFEDKDKTLEIMRNYNPAAAIIGTVKDDRSGLVTLETAIAGTRILDVPAGEILPRIC